VTLVLAYTSILRAYGEWIVETITGPMLGHVQVHAPLWQKDRLMERTLRNVDATLADHPTRSRRGLGDGPRLSSSERDLRSASTSVYRTRVSQVEADAMIRSQSDARGRDHA